MYGAEPVDVAFTKYFEPAGIAGSAERPWASVYFDSGLFVLLFSILFITLTG